MDLIKSQQSRIEQALLFAIEAHAGQVYRGYAGREDEPYIMHVLRVAANVHRDAVIVAILHDCLEDANRLPDWLTPEEYDAVKLVSRDKERVSYEEYILNIANAPGPSGRLARLVKPSDPTDHLVNGPPPSLRPRYERAFMLLRLSAQ